MVCTVLFFPVKAKSIVCTQKVSGPRRCGYAHGGIMAAQALLSTVSSFGQVQDMTLEDVLGQVAALLGAAVQFGFGFESPTRSLWGPLRGLARTYGRRVIRRVMVICMVMVGAVVKTM
jgi:hypothetical protein